MHGHLTSTMVLYFKSSQLSRLKHLLCLTTARAIIFLAPISAFDQVFFFATSTSKPSFTETYAYQYLDEDPRTNRIDDSLQIFSQICGNKLLKSAHLILMLNKVRLFWFHVTTRNALHVRQTDLLRQKIEAGIKVKKLYVVITTCSDSSIDVFVVSRPTVTEW